MGTKAAEDRGTLVFQVHRAMNSAPNDTPTTATQKSLPTVGSVLGSVLGSILAAKGKLDPLSAGSVIAATTALATAVCHWLGSKLGVAL